MRLGKYLNALKAKLTGFKENVLITVAMVQFVMNANRTSGTRGVQAIKPILNVIFAFVGGGIAVGVGLIFIGDSSTGILATGSAGDLNLTGLPRTIIGFGSLVLALALFIVAIKGLQDALG